MAGSQSSSSSVKKAGGDNGNGLILYQYYPSYYCQKVVFALNEKKIKYKSRIVDLYQGEQFEPGFIKLNPKSEVPVLQDGVKIIPDSRRIIDYLEDNFSNGGTPRLIPEKGTPQFQMMERMRDMLDNLPVQLVTFGCIRHPHLTGKIRLSQKEVEHKQGVHALHVSLLGDLCEKHRDFRDYYLVKKQGLEKVRAAVSDVNEVEKGILDVEYALNTAEKVLAQHTSPERLVAVQREVHDRGHLPVRPPPPHPLAGPAGQALLQAGRGRGLAPPPQEVLREGPAEGRLPTRDRSLPLPPEILPLPGHHGTGLCDGGGIGSGAGGRRDRILPGAEEQVGRRTPDHRPSRNRQSTSGF